MATKKVQVSLTAEPIRELTAAERLELLDVSGFKAKKEQIEEVAYEAIAEHVENIRATLRKIEAICLETGVTVDLSAVVGQAKNIDEDAWSSSSDYC